MPWPSKIVNALVGTTQQFGGDIMNLLRDLVTGVNIAASDATLKPDIATEFNFRNSLLGIKTPNNNNRFYFEVLANPSTAEDKKIGIPALILQTDNLVFNSQPATLSGKIMDYNSNTFQNFPPVGNAAGNTATFSGNASNKIFTMAHGYSGTPNSVVVVPKSVDALGDYVVTWDATNITVTYQQAPATGTNNVVLSWMIATSISTSGFTPGSTDTLTNKDLTDPSNTFPTSLERTANKNATNGYAGLTSGLIALSQIPTLDNAHLPTSLSGITIDFNANTIQNAAYTSKYIAFKSGSTFYVIDATTQKIAYSGTDAATVLQNALDNINGLGQRLVLAGNTTYSLSTSLILKSTTSLCGESKNGKSELSAAGNYPAIIVQESTSGGAGRVEIAQLYLTHNQATYSGGLIELRTTTGHTITSANIRDCFFYDNGRNVGNCIRFSGNDAAIYKVRVSDCEMSGFLDQIYIKHNGAGANDWINANSFENIFHWNPANSSFKLDSPTGSSPGAHFDGNTFVNCYTQAVSGTTGYDLNTAHLGRAFDLAFIRCFVVDTASGKDGFAFGTFVEADLVDCVPDWKIGGPGATNGKITKRSNYTRQGGIATFSGDATTTIFTVNTNLVATGGTVTPSLRNAYARPTSSDAVGNFWITSAGAGSFVINYAVPPPSGTNNLTYYWEAQT